MNYLSLDIGTTCYKCQLFSEKGEILEYFYKEYEFKRIDGENYVDVDAIWRYVKESILVISKKQEINSICISSLGESFVLLDKQDNVLFYPMLYTDSRGENEANEIKATVGEQKAFEITGVLPHSMYSLSKLLWIKNNFPTLLKKADKVMLICDYIGYLLTGERVIDYGLASRTGAFDVEKLEFSNEILNAFNLPLNLFSTPKRAGTIVGKIKPELKINATLVLGSHDQICSSLGAGALNEGDAVDGMGTVECITTLFKNKPTSLQMGRQGYPIVPYVIEGLYCTYILNFSCGSTVNWYRKKIIHEYNGDEKDFFSYIENGMPNEPTDIYVLPYFGGSATPYQNLNAKGAIINLTTKTSDSELYKAIMEGTAMEMRLNAEVTKKYAINVKNIVATGGGSNSKKWMQIKADIQNVCIKTLRSSEGGLCGCAILQAVAMGTAKSYEDAKKVFVVYDKNYYPNKEISSKYNKRYKKYKQIYKQIRSFN